MNVGELARIREKFAVVDDNGCWNWNRRPHRNNGYNGSLWQSSTRRVRSAHLVAYEARFGPVPAGLQLDHLCRNKLCLNPDHLEAVTSRENNRRKEQALMIGQYATHCRHGHEFTDENTYILPNRGPRGDWQHRQCRACNAAAAARYRARMSAVAA